MRIRWNRNVWKKKTLKGMIDENKFKGMKDVSNWKVSKMKINSKDTKTDFHIKGYLPPHSDTPRDRTHNLRYFKNESSPEKEVHKHTGWSFIKYF